MDKRREAVPSRGMIMNILAIDPSVNHLGWAIMTSGKVLLHGTINAPEDAKRWDIVQRLDWMLNHLDALMLRNTHSLVEIGEVPVEVVAIERPEPWGAYKSMASDRSGAMQMLTLLVGALTQWSLTLVGPKCTKLIKVSQHKGQLPKHITQERMEKKYKRKFQNDHEADAVSVGDYVLACEGV